MNCAKFDNCRVKDKKNGQPAWIQKIDKELCKHSNADRLQDAMFFSNQMIIDMKENLK